MTYCVALRLDAGLVFLADSRTNAGVDQISTFRKLTVFERPGERMLVMMTSGNLAISQAIVAELTTVPHGDPTLWNVASLLDAARLVGDAVRRVYARDAAALQSHGVDFNVNLILGGQIKGERCRLFHIYAAGNFIESRDEQLYFQIGESKYGKPIIDRVVAPSTSLDEAAKCALISMDSTLRSNVSVGLPLDLLLYQADTFRVTHFASITEQNRYFQMIRDTWGARLRQVFADIADPVWGKGDTTAELVPTGMQSQPVRVPVVIPDQDASAAVVLPEPAPGSIQTLAQNASP
jgi:putative proteasome-type protease